MRQKKAEKPFKDRGSKQTIFLTVADSVPESYENVSILLELLKIKMSKKVILNGNISLTYIFFKIQILDHKRGHRLGTDSLFHAFDRSRMVSK